ncbi:MAG: hypothetical protein HFF90_13060 [Oscillibacter sp.]|nr:hypothetical protein [Oscillibacter sp.]
MLISGRRAVRVLLSWLCVLLVAAECCGQSVRAALAPAYADVPNGDFELAHESGEWVGWTRSEGAFHARGLKSSDTIDGVQVEKSGSTFFSGYDAGQPSMRGTLTSDVFPLTGTGVISFMMGAGLNKNLVYVEFFQEGSETPLARVSNTDCDGVFITEQLITRTVDLSRFIGKQIYIKVTDLDSGKDLSYANLDNFHVCRTQAEVNAAQAQRARQLREYRRGGQNFTENPASTAIVNGGFETGDLTGWKVLEGRAIRENCVVPTSQYYWEDRMVYGEGGYYFDGNNNGAVRESLTGAMRSTRFTLAGDGLISFMMGCGNGDCYVALCDGNTNEELIVRRNEAFSDPALPLTLLRVYMDASAYLGRVVYMKVVNNNPAATGFAFLNVDDFRVSLTREEVAALEAEQIESVYAQTYSSASYDDLAALRDYYDNYPYPVPMKPLLIRDGVKDKVVECGKVDVTALLGDGCASYDGQSLTDFRVTGVTFGGKPAQGELTAVDMSVPGQYQVRYEIDHAGRHAASSFTVFAVTDRGQLLNGGFETGDLTGWTVLTKDFNRNTAVVSATSYWGDALPYNQAGDYHLNGWNTGLAEADTWSVQSSTFRLSGSGFISWRMGGKAAAVRVYRANGTQIAYVRQTRFNDANFPYLARGGSWADMGTYVLDLSAYLGEDLYIVLQDEAVDGGWANAFFDEIITRYDTPPDVAHMADRVNDGGTRAGITIPWRMAVNLVSGH